MNLLFFYLFVSNCKINLFCVVSLQVMIIETLLNHIVSKEKSFFMCNFKSLGLYL